VGVVGILALWEEVGGLAEVEAVTLEGTTA